MKLTNALGGCANCGALTSPCWRKGPEDARHLCNACGSRYLVKGTLEGYRPGQKNRGGSKRGKRGKGLARAQDHDPSSSPHKRSRYGKDQGTSTYADKAVQVNPLELQGMAPLPQLFAAADGSGTYLADSCSPTSPLERLPTEEASEGSLEGAKKLTIGLKGSSDESSPDQDRVAPGLETSARRRARKPFKPMSSTW